MTRSTSVLLHVNFRKFTTWLCQNSVSAKYLVNKLIESDHVLHMHWFFPEFTTELWTLAIAKMYVRVMALDYSQNFVSAIYLENKLITKTKSYICIDVDQLYMGIVMLHFLQIDNMVMALGYCQNFVSAQYVGNICIDVEQTRFWFLCVNLSKFITKLWPLVVVKILFPLNTLSVKEKTPHGKPAPTMYFMWHFLFVFPNNPRFRIVCMLSVLHDVLHKNTYMYETRRTPQI